MAKVLLIAEPKIPAQRLVSLIRPVQALLQRADAADHALDRQLLLLFE